MKKRKNYKKQLAEWKKKTGGHKFSDATSDFTYDSPGIPIAVSEIKIKDATTIFFDCPACKEANIQGNLYKRIEFTKLFFVIPIFKSTEIIISCCRCGKEFHPKANFSDLISGDKEFYNKSIRYNFSKEDTVLILIVSILSIIPIIGLVGILYLGIGKYSSTSNKCWQTWLLVFSIYIALISTGISVFYLYKLYFLHL
jgi:hypothetical protein